MEQGIVPDLAVEVLAEVAAEVASRTELDLDCGSGDP